jgi:hypothetical protein
MADFLCPKCGSIDHLEGQTVFYPRQCPGCDEVFDRASPRGFETQANAQPAVRMQLLRTDAWRRAKRRRATLARARIWAGAAALFVGLIGIYTLFSWPGLMASTDQAGVNVAASSHPITQTASPESAQVPKLSSADIPPAAVQDRGLSQRDAGLAPGKESADPVISAGNSASSEAPADEAAKLGDPLPTIGDRPVQSPDPPTAFARHIGLATPRYERVRMLSRPSWSGEEIQELSSVDMLLVLDAKPLHSWLHVMEIHSGAQGWVLESQVRVGSGSE